MVEVLEDDGMVVVRNAVVVADAEAITVVRYTVVAGAAEVKIQEHALLKLLGA